jgi:hypothetical protein
MAFSYINKGLVIFYFLSGGCNTMAIVLRREIDANKDWNLKLEKPNQKH